MLLQTYDAWYYAYINCAQTLRWWMIVLGQEPVRIYLIVKVKLIS